MLSFIQNLWVASSYDVCNFPVHSCFQNLKGFKTLTFISYLSRFHMKRKGYWKQNNLLKSIQNNVPKYVWHMYVWKICCAFCFRQASLASPLRILFVNLLFSTWQGLTSTLDSSSYAKHLRNLKQKTIDKLAWQKKELKNLASSYLS